MSLLLLFNPGLAGTSSLAFSPAGAMSAQGTLAGASFFAVSPTGTAVGAGVLAGASSLTLSATASAIGSGALSGITNSVFSMAGAVSATGLLTGSTDMVFAPAANLEGSFSLGDIGGSAGFGFALAGSLIDLRWFSRIAGPDTAAIVDAPTVALETIARSSKPVAVAIIEEVEPPLVVLS